MTGPYSRGDRLRSMHSRQEDIVNREIDKILSKVTEEFVEATIAGLFPHANFTGPHESAGWRSPSAEAHRRYDEKLAAAWSRPDLRAEGEALRASIEPDMAVLRRSMRTPLRVQPGEVIRFKWRHPDGSVQVRLGRVIGIEHAEGKMCIIARSSSGDALRAEAGTCERASARQERNFTKRERRAGDWPLGVEWPSEDEKLAPWVVDAVRTIASHGKPPVTPTAARGPDEERPVHRYEVEPGVAVRFARDTDGEPAEIGAPNTSLRYGIVFGALQGVSPDRVLCHDFATGEDLAVPLPLLRNCSEQQFERWAGLHLRTWQGIHGVGAPSGRGGTRSQGEAVAGTGPAGGTGARPAPSPGLRGLPHTQDNRPQVPSTLWIYRPVENWPELLKWAVDHAVPGAEQMAMGSDSGLHVTVAYSRARVDWNLITRDARTVEVRRSPRTMDVFDEGAVVLRLSAPMLVQRWNALLSHGCTWDYATYNPHVTLGRVEPDAADVQRDVVAGWAAYDGPIVLGPEEWRAID